MEWTELIHWRVREKTITQIIQTNGASGARLLYAYDEAGHLLGEYDPRQITRPSDNAAMWTWNSDPFGTDAANANPSGAGSLTTTSDSRGRSLMGRRDCTRTTLETSTRPADGTHKVTR
jgi:YD repeat-containing protein